jgi:hypothetical protein
MKFWAYRHINGSIHVKGYRADLPNARESINDAFESDFVDDVIDPFEAVSRQEAERIAKAKLDNLVIIADEDPELEGYPPFWEG